MSSNPRPIFDPARLELLKPYQDEAGRGLDLAIAESFLASTPGDIGKLKMSALSGDSKTFQRQAHTLKSTCAAVGADELAHHFEMMENGFENPQDWLKEIPVAEKQFETLKPILQNYISGVDWRKHG